MSNKFGGIESTWVPEKTCEKVVTNVLVENNPAGMWPVNPEQLTKVAKKEVTFVLFENSPSGIDPVRDVHPLNKDENKVTLGQLSNNPDGIVPEIFEFLNSPSKFVTAMHESNSPAGIDPVKKVVGKKQLLKVVTFLQLLNNPLGMAVSFELANALSKEVTLRKNTLLLVAEIVVNPLFATVNEVHPIFPHWAISLNSDLLAKFTALQVPSTQIV